MRNLLLFSLLAVSLAGCKTTEVAPQSELKRGEMKVAPKIQVVKNSILKLDVMPESMGRISQIYWQDTGKPIFGSYAEKVTVISPLFTPQTNNQRGVRELFWGQQLIKMSLPMSVDQQSDNGMTLRSEFYGNSQFRLRRTFRLLPESSIIEFSSELTSQAEKKQHYQLWFNFYLVQPMMPQIVWQAQKNAPEKIINFRPHQDIFPARRPWCGGYIPTLDTMFVFVGQAADFKPNGFVYSWYNNNHKAPIRTFEPVLAKCYLKPGETRVHHWRLLVFRGIKNLRGVQQHLAFDWSRSGSNLQVLVASAAADSGLTGQVEVKTASGKTFSYNFALPPATAGQVRKITLPNLPQWRQGSLALIYSGQRVELVGQL